MDLKKKKDTSTNPFHRRDQQVIKGSQRRLADVARTEMRRRQAFLRRGHGGAVQARHALTTSKKKNYTEHNIKFVQSCSYRRTPIASY